MQDREILISKAMKYCSRREVCIHDITQKLYAWGADDQDIPFIINILIKEKFIDELRYSKAFASDKFKFNNWGKNKIFYHLKAKKIPENLINEALQVIDNDEYKKVAKKLLLKKLNTLKPDTPNLKQKLYSYMANKGFDSDIFYEIIDEIFTE